MKFNFGDRSENNLVTCNMALQHIAKQALAYGLMDFAIIEGYRSDILQHEYFIEDKSKLDAGDPRAKHNQKPSLAFDAVPWIHGQPSWKTVHCCYLAGVIQAAAVKVGEPVRWGGNWDMDGEPITDQQFQDLVHYEII